MVGYTFVRETKSADQRLCRMYNKTQSKGRHNNRSIWTKHETSSGLDK